MSYTLNQLLEDVYAELGQLQVSTATGGTNTSLEDSKLIGSGADEDWKGGLLMLLEADGAAPEGEFSAIANYTDSSGTFNLAAEFSAAPENGDSYGLVSATYPVGVMLRLVNTGLRRLGDIPMVDNVTLVTSSGQSEYPTEVAWQRRPPYRIEIQVGGGDTTPKWERLHDWEYLPAAPGEQGRILFGQPLPDGRSLQVWYQTPHPRVSAYNDVIAEVISPSLAVAACVEQALRWANSRLGGGDAFMLQRWNDAKHTLEQSRRMHPIWHPKPSARMKLAGMGAR
jgi:hypothetical protein